MARMKYVQRRANRFEFRFPLPDDLAGHPHPHPWPDALAWLANPRTGRFKTELIRSLGTNDHRLAERAALPLIADALRLVDVARQALVGEPPSELAPGMVETLAREFEVNLLSNDEHLRKRGVGWNIAADRIAPDGLGMTDDDLAAYEAITASLDKRTRRDLAKMRGSEFLQQCINHSVQRMGIALHPDDPAWRELEIAFMKAQLRAVQGIQSRLQGEVVEPPAVPASGHVGETLSSALESWARGGGRAARKPRDNSVAEARRAVQRFIELNGDLPLRSITKAHGRQFRDALARVPKSLPQKLAKLRLPDLLKKDLSGFEPRNAQTINKNLNLVAGIVTKAEKDGHFEDLPSWSNPFHVAFDISHMERDHYEPFSVDELNRLLASPVYAAGKRPLGGKGEAAYWFPLIALFCGARRTEIAQLKVSDVREGDGIAFLDFNDEGEDQNLKNLSSARSMPIHDELVRLGFLDFVAERSQRAGPADALWVGFEPPIDDKAKAWTKWFGRYLGSHVVEHPSKTFHSFRHTFKRACREAGISEEIHHAFTGHSGGGVGRSYGRVRRSDGSMDRGVSLTRLKLELDRMSYPGLQLPRRSVAS
ncbi:site-specific integrase [Antarcticirhabdus aurantiaca]|uniref:Site-specific integrase n=1 Tax=Antarcticirhabdus aurantiaca TaxID=2606717 RepID=A0ACD4NLY9_9HYPH|nr:site-specific integrase [Antarcticirhabdus aurantiaca]WAJ27846.1 site-specific integrase [Jeongeuplla avenae]